MSKKPTNLPQEPFEQLKVKTGYAEFITDFALQLRSEFKDSDRMLFAMENVAEMFKRVEGWAQRSDLVGAATGIKKTQVEKSQDRENSLIVDGMSSEMPDEFGGLRKFRAIQNDEFLDSLNDQQYVEPATIEQSAGLPNPEEALALVYRIHEDIEGREAA